MFKGSPIRAEIRLLLLLLPACQEEAVASAVHEVPAAVTPVPETTPAQDLGPSARSSAPPATFLGEPDVDRVRSLQSQSIAKVEKGRGGRSLAFKITLVDGTQGYFKPEQAFSAAHWYSEVAAYYLDRELGLGRVAPTTGRRFEWAALQRAARGDKRIEELTISEDGTIRGAFIWWITEPLKRLRLGRRWELWLRVNPALPITPYQRPVDYRADLAGKPGVREATDPDRPRARPHPKPAERAAELSDMIVFDYLTQNVDRWGGDFTNVRTRGRGGPLIYLDNGAGFWPGEQQLGLMDARLKALQRFRRSTVEAVRALDVERFQRRMAADPLSPVLSDKQLAGLGARRQALLDHVQRLATRYGESQVLPW